MSQEWESMLMHLEPNYEQCEQFIRTGKLQFSLTDVPTGLLFSIHNNWMCFTAQQEIRIAWISSILECWTNVLKLDSTLWLFRQRELAHKFLTLYNLTWTE